MKKVILLCTAASLTIVSCKKDDNKVTVDVATQNSYDDQAAQAFLNANYFNAKGRITAFSDTDASDDNYPKLSSYNPVVLPDGVIYIVRPGAQPTNGTTIGSTDVIKYMGTIDTYVATSTNGTVSYASGVNFMNTLSTTGVPYNNPYFYYVPQTVLDAGTTTASQQAGYYEIPGFREALQKFQAFNMNDSDAYNLQGVIIVPSRDAFARNASYAYNGLAYTDRSFVFNFQIYKSTPR